MVHQIQGVARASAGSHVDRETVVAGNPGRDVRQYFFGEAAEAYASAVAQQFLDAALQLALLDFAFA